MLAAVLPLARPVWFEAALAAQHGTAMIMGYGADPAADGRHAAILRWSATRPAPQVVRWGWARPHLAALHLAPPREATASSRQKHPEKVKPSRHRNLYRDPVLPAEA
jgi:hypothetical protein